MRVRERWRAVPVDDWPEGDRLAWKRGTPGWAPRRTQAARAAFGQFLSFEAPIGAERVAAFAEAVAGRLAPQSARTVLRGLAQALVVLRPGEPWGWLHEAARAAARAGRPGRTPTTKTRRDSGLRLAFDDWPDEHQGRWRQGLMPPPVVIEEDPYSAAVAAVEASIRMEEAGDENAAVATAAKHPSSWRPATLTAARNGWGRWLAWVRGEGGSVEPEAVAGQRVAHYVNDLHRRGCAPYSIAAYVRGLHFALRVLAPGADWTWLSRRATVLQQQAVPAKDKLAALRPIEDLAALGAGLMLEAAGQLLTLTSAKIYRDGLFITLLAWRPKRISNLGSMRIGKELVIDDAGEPATLRFSRTKNGQKSESTVPEVLRPAVRAYLERFRPLLEGRGSDALWVSRRGTAMMPGALAKVLRERTRAAWGRGIGPHYVRTIYTTSVGAYDPRLLRQVSGMLDHRDPQTVQIYEAYSRTANASRQLDRMTTAMVETPARRGGRNRRRPGL